MTRRTSCIWRAGQAQKIDRVVYGRRGPASRTVAASRSHLDWDAGSHRNAGVKIKHQFSGGRCRRRRRWSGKLRSVLDILRSRRRRRSGDETAANSRKKNSSFSGFLVVS